MILSFHTHLEGGCNEVAGRYIHVRSPLSPFMHKIPKWLSYAGSFLLILGFFIGFLGLAAFTASPAPNSEDWSGELMFEGTTEANYTEHFSPASTYNIWVMKDSNVTVEVIDGNKNNLFEPCEDYEDDCSMYDEDGAIPGFQYIGELAFDNAGTYTVEFRSTSNETIDVMIREDTTFFYLMVAGGGFSGCCSGIVLLGIGGLLSRVFIEPPSEDSKLVFETYEPLDSATSPESLAEREGEHSPQNST